MPFFSKRDINSGIRSVKIAGFRQPVFYPVLQYGRMKRMPVSGITTVGIIMMGFGAIRCSIKTNLIRIKFFSRLKNENRILIDTF
jgi:hypothetical protein